MKVAAVFLIVIFNLSVFAQSGASISVAPSTSEPQPPTSRAPLVKKVQARKKKKSRDVAPLETLEARAAKELVLPKDDRSTDLLQTPATVRSKVEEVANPLRPLEFLLGVSVQPFSPKGSMPVTDLAPYNLSDAGTNAMIAIDGQWLPLEFEGASGLKSGLKSGVFVSVGYAQFNLALRSPTGVQLEDTKLHAIKAQLGLTASYQLPKAPLWSAHGNLGIGRLQLIQSSTASSQNASSAIGFASVGAAAERRLSKAFSVYGGYDFRFALARTSDGADVSNHNWLIGFLGNF